MKQFFMRYPWISATILTIVFLCIFAFRLSRADIDGDSATYLYRAWGYIDYMSSSTQTTPLQWFTTVPWWVRLGFHDAPPLYFLFHHVTLSLTNGNPLAVEGIHALFGALLCTLLFFVASARKNIMAGFLAVGLVFAITPLFLIHRTALLESFMLIWLALGMFAFVRAQQQSRYWYIASISFAAAMLTKYTAVFILLGPLVWTIAHPRILRVREAWLSLLLFLVLVSPVAIYNVAMYRAVGHPDLQFSSLIGLDTSAHWSRVQRSLETINNSNHFVSLVTSVNSMLFPTATVLLVLVLLGFAYYTCKKRDALHVTIAISLFGSVVAGLILTAAYRYMAPFFLMSAIAGAVLLHDLGTAQLPRLWRHLGLTVFFLLAAGGWIQSTVTAYAYMAPTGIWTTPLYEPNLGFAELDAYLRSYYATRYPSATINFWGLFTPDTALRQEFERVQQAPGDTPYADMLIYDERASWFSNLWYNERWNLYRTFTHMSTDEYTTVIEKDPHYFDRFDHVSLIVSHHPSAPGRTEAEYHALTILSDALVHYFEQNHAAEKIIYAKDGSPAFTIYGTLAK